MILQHMSVTIKPYSDSKKPHLKFVVHYPSEKGTARKRGFFKTKQAAKDFANEKEIEFKNVGTAASALTDALKMEALRCNRELALYHRTLTDAVTYYVDYLKATEKSEHINKLLIDFHESMEIAGKSAAYLNDLKSRLRKFENAFGDRYASEITTRLAEDWIFQLKVGNLSKNHYRRVLSAFFSYCERLGYCAHNPITKIPKVKVKPSTTEIFTPTEMQKMLSASDGDIRAYLAICAFAGLRDAEAKRLEWKNIRWESEKIDLSKAQTKTAQRRLVNMESNLIEWLTPYRLETGPICKPNFININRFF